MHRALLKLTETEIKTVYVDLTESRENYQSQLKFKVELADILEILRDDFLRYSLQGFTQNERDYFDFKYQKISNNYEDCLKQINNLEIDLKAINEKLVLLLQKQKTLEGMISERANHEKSSFLKKMQLELDDMVAMRDVHENI